MTAFKLKAPLPTEDDEAQCLIQWAKTQRWKGKPLNSLVLMIPNGAYLGGDARQRAITMARLKRQGFRNGIFDFLIPIPRATSPGLWLELKRRQLGVVSLEQSQFQMAMLDLGWATAIAKGWEEAKDAISEYLRGGA
jgi:hypothetical protein